MNGDPKRQRFEQAYEGKPPWDLGRPQQPFVDHADRITGSVLDVGCGTGENALFFADRGQTVLGIDFVAAPVETARHKAAQRGVQSRVSASGRSQARRSCAKPSTAFIELWILPRTFR